MMKLTAGLLSFVALSARAQSLPTNREAASLLQGAADAANLESPGSPLFHLVAKVHYELDSRPFDGMYELFWASPERLRENYKIGTVAEIRLAMGDKLYTLRNTQTLNLSLWRLQTILTSSYHGFHPAKPKVDKVYSAQVGGENRACVESEENSNWMKACFDPITRGAVSLSTALRFPHGVSTEDKLFLEEQLSDFASLGAKRYPRRIVYHQEGEKMDIEVTTLDEVNQFEPEVFTPPTAAQVYDWCPNPERKGKISYESMPRITPQGSLVLPAYYVFVGADGKAKKSGPMRSGGDLLNERMKEWIEGQRFPLYSCGGTPIPYETVLVPTFVFPSDR